MTRFLALAAIVALCAASSAPAHARGGWDGNGLNINGVNQNSLGTNGVTQKGIEVDNCASDAASNGARLRYVELPGASGTEPTVLHEISPDCPSEN
jgi:hypothetical protein